MDKLGKEKIINSSDLTASSALTPGDASKNSNYIERETYEMKEYPARWFALIGFGLGSAMNGIVWISLVAITDEVEDAYGVDAFFLNMWSYVFMIFYIPCNFIANYTHESIGVRYGIMVGLTFTCIGAWFKIFWNVNFRVFVIIGNWFAAFGQPFFLNAPALLTNTWFNEKHRTVMTSLASMSNSMGTAFGMIFPTFFVTKANGNQQINEDNKIGVRNQILIQAIASTLFLLFGFFLVQNKPKTPPSASASIKREPFLKSLQTLMKDIQFLKLMLWYGWMNAIFGNFATLIGELTTAYDFEATQRGIFGMFYLVGGIVGANIFGFILSRTKAYKVLATIIPTLTIGTIALFYFTLPTETFVITCMTSFLVGSTVLPAIPICYEFAAEITFPVGEASSSGSMMLCGQLLSFSLGMVTSSLMNNSDKKKGGFISLVVLAGAAWVSILAALIVKPNFKRDRTDSKLGITFEDNKKLLENTKDYDSD